MSPSFTPGVAGIPPGSAAGINAFAAASVAVAARLDPRRQISSVAHRVNLVAGAIQ